MVCVLEGCCHTFFELSVLIMKKFRFIRTLCVCLAALVCLGSGTWFSVQAQDKPHSTAIVSEELNDHLPSWLRVGGEYRLRWEGRTGQGGTENRDDSYFLNRVRLDLTFKLSKQWTVFVQAQDAKAFGFNTHPVPASYEDSFDLRQAYVEWRQDEKHGWSLKAGRQELNYGDQRLVGAANWGNSSRTFDAVKVGYMSPKFAVDAFASSVVAIDDEHFDRHRDGNNLYGVFASLPKLNSKMNLNTYVFWKTEQNTRSERGLIASSDVVTFGSQLKGQLSPRFDYDLDVMGQRGSFSKDEIQAHAVHTRLGYALNPKQEHVPKLFVEYNHASGDGTPGDGIRGTFDQLFPTGHARYGAVDQVGLRNMHNAQVGTIWKPRSNLNVQLDYQSFWLAHRRDGLYNSSGALAAILPNGAPDAHVAQEVDLQVQYNFRPGVSFGSGFGHWIPGAFWKAATPGSPQTFAYSFMTYRF